MNTNYWPADGGNAGAVTLDWFNRRHLRDDEPPATVWTTSGSTSSVSGTMVDFNIARRMASQVTSVTLLSWFEALVPSGASPVSATQREKNAAALRLIEGWLSDESGYDEAVWPRVKAAIEANRMSDRSRFGN